MSWVRTLFSLRERCRERYRIGSAAENLGLGILDSPTIETFRILKPDAKKVFILGTGASVNSIEQEGFEHMNSNFSIGVNQWIFHPFIPDLYSYEADPDVRLLHALDRTEVQEKRPPLLVLRPTKREDFRILSHVPESVRAFTFLYGRHNLWTRNRQNIGIDYLRALRHASLWKRRAVMVDNGASIVRLVSLCIQMKFSEIIFVGVDLNNVEYFWGSRPAYLKRFGIETFETAQRGATHETLSTTSRPFGVDTFLSELEQALRENLGIKLFVASQKSHLAQFLPVYAWPSVGTS